MAPTRESSGGRVRRASGFSLLEAMVGMSLIAILAGFGVLSHQAIRPTLHLSMAARQVVMDLKLARLHAVVRNVNYRIVFPTGGGSYRTQRKTGNTYSDEGDPVSLPSGIVIASCTATGSGIGFRSRGNAATFGTVTLQNINGAIRRIIVDIAGEVRVQ